MWHLCLQYENEFVYVSVMAEMRILVWGFIKKIVALVREHVAT